jgi:hypothetical protein
MMKKKVLSLAVAGAMMGVGGAANAALQFAPEGIGHILLIPYFSVQNGNNTLINIANTDLTNGKAVKIRFRGGRDSDDIYDFQLFLSPGDVWTANVSQGTDGVAKLTTTDNSCTLPTKAILNATPFPLARLSTTDAASGIGTREGYVEIFNMGDMPPGTTATSPTYATTKHASGGSPTCSAAVLENIENSGTVGGAASLASGYNSTSTATILTNPSGGLMANWTIINVPNTTVFTGEATTLVATAVTNIVYSRQTSDSVAAFVSTTAFPGIATTFDGVLLTTGFATAEFDFPDLSTPYDTSITNAGAQVYALSGQIARSRLINEFLLDSTISAKTDWLVSMPTRRYLVAGRGTNAAAGGGTYVGTVALLTSLANTVAATDTCVAPTSTGGSCTYAGDGTTAKAGGQGWFRGVTTYVADNRSSCVNIGTYTQYDREEASNVTSNVVVSPGVVTTVALCGEVNILSLNNLTGNTAAVGANLVVAGLSIPYSAGWATVNLDAATHTGGLPVIGRAFVKATNPAVAAGVSGNFGGAWAHRW